MFTEERNLRLERVGFELRSSGVKSDQTRRLYSGIHNRGYLPHVKREGASYFVTFRLADSLPKDVFFKLQQTRAGARARLAAHHPEAGSAAAQEELTRIERAYLRELEAYLDKGCGSRVLGRPEAASVVSQTLTFFEGKQYLLKAWVVMPTHVHVVVWPLPNHTLSAILHSWKTYSGKEVNKLLRRSGQSLWQSESYDHWIRNELEHERCCGYVINNPVKAGLCKSPGDWQWSSAWSNK